MQTISEDVLRRVANVLGPSTGAAEALKGGLKLRSEGLEVVYWNADNSILVESRRPGAVSMGACEPERRL